MFKKFLQALWKSIIKSLDKFFAIFRDPIKTAEKKIVELNKFQQEATTSLGNIKAMSIETKRNLEKKLQEIKIYEESAAAAIRKAKRGEISSQEADRKAAEALSQKNTAVKEAKHFKVILANYGAAVKKTEASVSATEHQIRTLENEILTLKARKKMVDSTKKITKSLEDMSSGATGESLKSLKSELKKDEQSIALTTSTYSDMLDLESDFESSIESDALLYDTDIQSELNMLKSKVDADNEEFQSNIENIRTPIKN